MRGRGSEFRTLPMGSKIPKRGCHRGKNSCWSPSQLGSSARSSFWPVSSPELTCLPGLPCASSSQTLTDAHNPDEATEGPGFNSVCASLPDSLTPTLQLCSSLAHLCSLSLPVCNCNSCGSHEDAVHSASNRTPERSKRAARTGVSEGCSVDAKHSTVFDGVGYLAGALAPGRARPRGVMPELPLNENRATRTGAFIGLSAGLRTKVADQGKTGDRPEAAPASPAPALALIAFL